MTLDEVIKRFSDNAEYERTHGSLQGCLEFRQLAEWLTELKKLQELTYPCEDCVSRQAVLECFEMTNTRPGAKHAIVTLPSVQPEQKWIPVSERLPEDGQPVLMTICRMSKLYNHEPFITIGHISWNQTRWWCAHDGYCARNEIEVVAWMPLPKPYKESEDN